MFDDISGGEGGGGGVCDCPICVSMRALNTAPRLELDHSIMLMARIIAQFNPPDDVMEGVYERITALIPRMKKAYPDEVHPDYTDEKIAKRMAEADREHDEMMKRMQESGGRVTEFGDLVTMLSSIGFAVVTSEDLLRMIKGEEEPPTDEPS